MIRFFKSSQAATLFIIPVIVLLGWAQSFFSQSFVVSETGMPVYKLFMRALAELPGFIRVLIAVVLVSLEAIYLNIIVNRHEVLFKNSYLPALMYALLMSLAFPLIRIHPVILTNLVLLVALDKLFSLFKNESPISPLFNGGFFISIASLTYFPAAAIFILFLLALARLRPFSFREWIIACIGFFLPYFFLSVYFFWTDQLDSGWKNILANFITVPSRFGFSMDRPLLVLLTWIGILFLLSINRLRQNFYKNVIRTRANQQVLVLYFLIAAISSLLLKIIPLYYMTLLAIPLAVFFSYYFLAEKKRPWVSELILWLTIGLVVWNHV